MEDKTESSTEEGAAAPAPVESTAETTDGSADDRADDSAAVDAKPALNDAPALNDKADPSGKSSRQSPTGKKTSNKANTTPSARTGLAIGLAILAVVLALAAVAVTFYLWQGDVQQQQQQQRSQADIAAALQRIDVQVSDNRQLQRQLDQQNASADQLKNQLQQQIDQLLRQQSSQKKRLLSLSTTDREDWLLAEAEYLIRLANQRLLMGKEVDGALDLLKAADDIARELDDSGLYLLRQALADDMAALRAAGSFDLEGIYFQLGALAKQSDQLQLIELPQLTTALSEAGTLAEANTPATWQQRLGNGFRRAWEKLSSYVQIKRRDEIYQPLFAPEYEAAVRQNVRLMFEQAQMATLAGKQQLYTDSLAKAQQWLGNYYTHNREKTAAVTRAIETLAGQKIELTLPDISGSLRALKAYQESVHSITPESKVDGSPDSRRVPVAPEESV